jgi:Cu+-exporting ATPase
MEAQRERDVVCGMMVDPAKAAGTSEYNGTTYYFCGKGCKAKFDADPENYLTPASDSRLPAPGSRISDPGSRIPAASTKWTCPMHPEIVRDGPGRAPSAAWPSSR